MLLQILTLLVMSFIVVIVTPINMGLWGLPASEGGIPLDFYLVGVSKNTKE